MEKQITKTTNRRYPEKPSPVSTVVKESSSEKAIEFLNQFVVEARKEIRERATATVSGRFSKRGYEQVVFVSESFSLTIDFKGGMKL